MLRVPHPTPQLPSSRMFSQMLIGPWRASLQTQAACSQPQAALLAHSLSQNPLRSHEKKVGGKPPCSCQPPPGPWAMREGWLERGLFRASSGSGGPATWERAGEPCFKRQEIFGHRLSRRETGPGLNSRIEPMHSNQDAKHSPPPAPTFRTRWEAPLSWVPGRTGRVGAAPPAPSTSAVCQRLLMPSRCQRRAAHRQAPAQEISWPRPHGAFLSPTWKGGGSARSRASGPRPRSPRVRLNVQGPPEQHGDPLEVTVLPGREPGVRQKRPHLEDLSAGGPPGGCCFLSGAGSALSGEPVTPPGLGPSGKGDREREGVGNRKSKDGRKPPPQR